MKTAKGYKVRYSLAATGWLLLAAFSTFGQKVQEPVAVDLAQGQSQDQPATQTSPVSNASNQDAASKDSSEKKDDRMFFIMPNLLTVDNESQAKPMSTKEKFSTTIQGVLDPYEFVVVGVLAGVRQAENADPGFGQGFEGYAKRYGAGFADQADGNFMVGAVFPTMLKTDPRYFRLGKGTFAHRFAYSFSRILITRRDSGGHLFNIPEFAGNATAIAISNLYYPASDRGFSASANNWGVQMGIDALGNELKEFWPDIHRYLKKKKPKTATADNPSD